MVIYRLKHPLLSITLYKTEEHQRWLGTVSLHNLISHSHSISAQTRRAINKYTTRWLSQKICSLSSLNLIYHPEIPSRFLIAHKNPSYPLFVCKFLVYHTAAASCSQVTVMELCETLKIKLIYHPEIPRTFLIAHKKSMYVRRLWVVGKMRWSLSHQSTACLCHAAVGLYYSQPCKVV